MEMSVVEGEYTTHNLEGWPASSVKATMEVDRFFFLRVDTVSALTHEI